MAVWARAVPQSVLGRCQHMPHAHARVCNSCCCTQYPCFNSSHALWHLTNFLGLPSARSTTALGGVLFVGSVLLKKGMQVSADEASCAQQYSCMTKLPVSFLNPFRSLLRLMRVCCTGQVRRLISNPTVKKDFAALLAGLEGDKRKLAQLSDLLERLMHLDPDKRLSPKEALRHPFIKDSAAK